MGCDPWRSVFRVWLATGYDGIRFLVLLAANLDLHQVAFVFVRAFETAACLDHV
jgi:hypothetical protein